MQVTQEQSFYLTSLKYTKKIINGNLNLHFFSIVIYITFFYQVIQIWVMTIISMVLVFTLEYRSLCCYENMKGWVSKLSLQSLHYYVSTHMKSFSFLDHSNDSLILQELIGNYIYMEEYFMRETVMKVSLVLLLKLKI